MSALHAMRGFVAEACALALLAVLAVPSRAKPPKPEVRLSYFKPVENGCEWRLLELPSLRVRVVHRFDICPTRLAWRGRRAVAAHDNGVWAGDWTRGKLKPLGTPLPLPARGRLERAGFDAKGRPTVIVSAAIDLPEQDRKVPGAREATHVVAAHAYADGRWKLLRRERALLGGTSAPGVLPLYEKIDWRGAVMADRLGGVRATGAEPYLIVKDRRVFARTADGDVFLAFASDLPTEIERDRIGPRRRRGSYALLPSEPPVRWLALRLDRTPGPHFSVPVWMIDVERGWFFRAVDMQQRSLNAIAVEVRGPWAVTTEEGRLAWPRLFGPPNMTLRFEDRAAHHAFFFP